MLNIDLILENLCIMMGEQPSRVFICQCVYLQMTSGIARKNSLKRRLKINFPLSGHFAARKGRGGERNLFLEDTSDDLWLMPKIKSVMLELCSAEPYGPRDCKRQYDRLWLQKAVSSRTSKALRWSNSSPYYEAEGLLLYCCVPNIPPLDLILSRLNPIHILFNIILSTFRSTKWFVALIFWL